jgi:2'-5' RNA ligase
LSLVVIAYPEIEQRNYDWIESLRIKYDQAYYNIVRPHFTLVFPAEGIAENALIDHVEACVRRVPPIPFVLRAASIIYDQFTDRWLVLLIPDEGNGRLSRLHDSLYTGILADKWLMKILYIPHVTVAMLEDCQKCKNLTAELNRDGLEIAGLITAVEVMSYQDKALKPIKRVSLTGKPIEIVE